ncbi:MAG: CPBP family intramembrane metalloprotease [Hyphomicrobium sp.]|nr:CPBP family intramembrane metalloprotease [Hyphomicrobium sp.]PPD07643.1 MAG: CPBP family intramembrane metalloprotease [Hyphomicrobium sp.]
MVRGQPPNQGSDPISVAAGGTLIRRPLTGARVAWLVTELALLFIAAPLAMHAAVHQARIPLFVALLPILGIVLTILLADRTFSLKAELARSIPWRTLLSILVVFAVGALGVWAWLKEAHPGWLFEFPRNRPDLWLTVMLAYPVVSVATQEIVYRTFFFHRYGPLFGPRGGLAIAANGVLFGFAHIVIGQPFAVVATILGGCLFAARYQETRSFWAVFVEHTLWGAFIFTIGLGRYFFTGISNV